MPPNYRLRANDVKGVAPPRPPFREPHPEGAIERTKLRPLRAAAEHCELLSERQVLEHEVGTRPENCAQGTYQSSHEVHSLTSLTEEAASSLMIEFWQGTRKLPARNPALDCRVLRASNFRQVALFHGFR